MNYSNIKHGNARYFKLAVVILFIIYTGITGCKKFIEVEAPVTSVNGGNVYADDANAIAAVTGIYTTMANTNFTLNCSLFQELAADNFRLISLDNLNFSLYYQNSLTTDYAPGTTQFWNMLYEYIYKANAAIEGLNKATTLTPAIKQRLLGEVYFVRAFCFFYLVNLYGDVPLPLSSDYLTNNKLSRSAQAAVNQQIIDDLLSAQEALDKRYLDGSLVRTTSERVRPNLMAVNALLARQYLFTGNYPAANSLATTVIQSTDLFNADIPLTQVFLKNSPETIWSLQPVKANANTDEGNFYVSESSGPDNTRPVFLSESFLNSIEETDQRKVAWVGSNTIDGTVYAYPAKYKIKYGESTVDEYPIVLRLSEQYLIRAEARARDANLNGSRDDLNVIRKRAGLANTTANTEAELLAAISKERRIELFAEWGDRWINLKRTGELSNIMQLETPKKGGVWQAYKALYPIPASEIQINSNLAQNPGYN